MGMGIFHISGITTVNPAAPIPIDRRSAPHLIIRRAQRERRARILAAARLVITQDINADVTIRDIANRSDVSAQTIYNLVGNRAQLVEDAINEHITNTASCARCLENYPNLFLAIADFTWISISQNSEYSRNVTNACDTKYFFAYKKICERNARSLSRLLKRHYDFTEERGEIDVDALAWHITTLVGSSALDWARGLYDLSELRYRFAFAYGAPLMTITQPEERKEIVRWMEAIRRGDFERG